MAQGDDDPLDSVVMVVVTAGGAADLPAAGVAPDANRGEPKGVHHGNSLFVLVLMAACEWASSSWWLGRSSWNDGCQALQCTGRLPA